MEKNKVENKAIQPAETKKTQKYSFPEYGVSIEASSHEEAVEKLNEKVGKSN